MVPLHAVRGRSICLARLPITWPTALMRHRDYFYDVSRNTVVHAKRKSGEDNPTCSVDGQRPSFWSFKYSLDNEIKFQQKGLSRYRATLGIPRRRPENFLLSFRMEPEFNIHLGDEGV